MKIVCREPYRIFFPLGVVIGCLGVGHWLVYALGWTGSYSGFVHAGIQMQAYMGCFIVGFLMTAIPRFSGAAHANPLELILFLALMLGLTASHLTGRPVLAEILFIFLLVNLLVFAGRRFAKKKSEIQPPVEFIWIPIAILHGIAGAVLIIGVNQGWTAQAWITAARPMVEQGFLLAIVTGVGGFLAPRLMGRTEVIRRNRLAQAFLYLGLGVLLFSSFVLEGKGMIRPAYALRAFVPTVVFFRNHAWPHSPRTQETFVKLLWLSIGMVILGNWLTALLPLYRKALLHFVFIGGYSLMTFAVGTMVIYTHGGDAAALRRPLWALRFVLAGIFLTLPIRFFSDFFPQSYFFHLGIAAAIFIITGILWLFSVLPKICHYSSPEEFERCHDEAKKRLQTGG